MRRTVAVELWPSQNTEQDPHRAPATVGVGQVAGLTGRRCDGWHLNTFIIPHTSLTNHNMLHSYSDMGAQTHSPFETLARVIEHLDAGGRSVRRTEAAGSGEGEPLRATLEVSVPEVVGPGASGHEPVDVSIDDGLSVTYRTPSFPDLTESLPPEHPPVSVTATGVETDEEGVVVTVEVTIDADGGSAVDTARTDGSAVETGRDATNAGGTATFGTGWADADARGDMTTDGESARDGEVEPPDDDGSAAGSENAESPLATVRDESVPPYDDTPYLRRLYETCETFAEMSDRIEMDVSAETVRRYTIEAGVHSPNSYETGDRSRDDSDEGTVGTPQSKPESGAGSGDPSGTPAVEASHDGGSETAAESATARAAAAGGGEEPAAGRDARSRGSLPDEQLVADGIGLPDELTLREVVNAVVDARTVHEVQRDIGLGYERTRQLLTQLNVLDLVVGRVDVEPDRDSTVDVVTDRIRQCAPDAT